MQLTRPLPVLYLFNNMEIVIEIDIFVLSLLVYIVPHHIEETICKAMYITTDTCVCEYPIGSHPGALITSRT